ncbi:MAG: RNA-guided pseudouridylation complex pseudouridine synthase subunit Cbf5 [Candidatus Woesearchaeota archaeon]
MEELLPFEKRSNELFVKREAKTDSKFGCKPEERPTEEIINYGIVNIDKPKGPTSHQVSAYVQQILGIDKSGHSGTLDPQVSGVLPIALGRGTKVIQAMISAGKEYICIMHLHKDVPEGKIRDIFSKFTTKIMQLPPVKSAVKRQMREREIYYMKIIEIKEKDVLFVVGCQAGTYIRKLCHDVGKELGVGAHMVELRRTKAASFDEKTLVTLQDLKDAFVVYKEEGKDIFLRKCILPVEYGVSHLPKIWILDSTVNSLTHGTDLAIPGISKLEKIEKEQLVAVMTLKNELVAIGKAMLSTKEILEMEKGIAVSVEKVFMEPGIYPKIRKLTDNKL